MKILAIKFRALGDTVLWTSALDGLKKMYPGADIDVLSLESNRALLENRPGVRRFYGLEKRDGFPLLKMFWRLRRERYDLALAFHANTSVCRWLFLLNAGEKLAHHHSWKYSPPCSDRPLARPGELLNAIERDYEVLRALGWKGDPLPTRLAVSQEASSIMEKRLVAAGLKGAKKRLALLPGASEKLKRYPQDLWEKVIQSLKQSGRYELAVIADPRLSNEWTMKEWCQSLGIALFDDLNLTELVAILSRFNCSVSCDSGPGHMAAALGLKTVHIFGRGCLGDFHPYDLKFHRYLRVKVDCRAEGPQDLEEFRFCTVAECSHLSCLRKIPPEDVAATSLALDSVIN